LAITELIGDKLAIKVMDDSLTIGH